MSDLRDKIARALRDQSDRGWTREEYELFGPTDLSEFQEAADAVLDAIDLDTVRAEAEVEGLREVAKDRERLDAAAKTGMNEYGGPFAWNAAKGVRDYLYDRADRIARGAGIETGEQ